MSDYLNKYSYQIDWSEDDQEYIATCLEFPGLSSIEETQEQALIGLKEVLEESINWLKEEGKEIPEPFSLRKYNGKLLLRTSPEVHRQIALEAARAKLSINQYMALKLTGS